MVHALKPEAERPSERPFSIEEVVFLLSFGFCHLKFEEQPRRVVLSFCFFRFAGIGRIPTKEQKEVRGCFPP